jgi:hypothetical protein
VTSREDLIDLIDLMQDAAAGEFDLTAPLTATRSRT